MIFFMLPILLAEMAVGAAVMSGVVFAVAFAFIRKQPILPNQYGPLSGTRTLWTAIFAAFKRMFDFRGRANRLDFWTFAVFAGFVSFRLAVCSCRLEPSRFR